jgi:hypothetical protein
VLRTFSISFFRRYTNGTIFCLKHVTLLWHCLKCQFRVNRTVYQKTFAQSCSAKLVTTPEQRGGECFSNMAAQEGGVVIVVTHGSRRQVCGFREWLTWRLTWPLPSKPHARNRWWLHFSRRLGSRGFFFLPPSCAEGSNRVSSSSGVQQQIDLVLQ